MAPGHIAILIECHVFPYREQCHHLKHDMQAHRHFVNSLLKEGMIETDPREAPPHDKVRCPFVVTDKGSVYVHALTQIPLPTAAWSIA